MTERGPAHRDIDDEKRTGYLVVETKINLWKFDRLLLATYLIVLLGVLTFPIDDPEYSLLGIGIDKFTHVALFGGLAVFLRWSLAETRHALAYSIGVASLIAAAVELVQGLVAYRNADPADLLAGFLGAIVGAIGMNRVLASPAPEKLIGLIVAALGVMASAVFLLADVIGLTDNVHFGSKQLAGTVLGSLMGLAGLGIFVKAVGIESRSKRRFDA